MNIFTEERQSTLTTLALKRQSLRRGESAVKFVDLDELDAWIRRDDETSS